LVLLFPGLQSSLRGAETNEQQLIQVLQSKAALMEKDAACVQLKRIGTARSMPALAALLTDEQLSQSARYALEAMSSLEAGRSLVAALGNTAGLTKAGIIDSLGIRRETNAVPALAKALGDSDLAVATAAATALGQIANPEAMATLQSASIGPTGPVQNAVVDATLRCANHLLTAGEQPKALALFQQLYATQKDDPIRVAAYRGLLLASGEQALTLATQAISGKGGPSQTAALQLVHDLDASGATTAFARLLPQVSFPVQVALIEGLDQRNDPSAATAIAALVGNISPGVRVAALDALGSLGDATAVTQLAEAAASATGAEQAAARASLVQLRRGQPAETMLSQMLTAKPAVQAELARALGARGESAAIPKLLELARQGSDLASKAAMQALAQLVDQGQLASLVQLVLELKNEAARAQAAEALNSACHHIQSRHGRVEVEPLAKGLATGTAEARMALLPVCAGFNDPQVRTALRAAINDAPPPVRAAAIRALCDTTDAELLPDLVRLACAAPEENLRSLAIGGCVRLTTQEETVKLSNSERVETFKAILAANPSAGQKRLVLAGLAEIPDTGSLKLAEPMLADAAVQVEAARAVIKLASALPDGTMALAALKKVLAATQDPTTRSEAEAAIKKLDSGAGFISGWQVAGPYRQAGKDYTALFDTAFPPETSGTQSVSWRALAGADARRPGIMDLLKALGGQECVAYARATIHSDREQTARLELGSDDGVKVWLNQKLVHAKNVARPLRPGSDKVNVALNAGWNQLLLKITQHNQGWAFCARLVQPDGSPLGGLQSDAGPLSNPVEAAPPLGQPAVSSTAFAASTNCDRAFERVQITDKFWAEGASFGDFNRDGNMDIVSGPFWYEGPDFKKRHEIWPATTSFTRKKSDGSEESIPGFEGALGTKNTYSECFLTFTCDFNNDGWPDVLIIGFPGKAAAWYENPKGAEGPWPRHQVFDEVGDESPGFADVTGDGKPEILCCARGCIGYVQADWKNPAAPWTFHPITPKGAYQKFTHGLGCGDINGDGRVDIIEKDGWWEQPASCAGDPVWTKHPFHFADAGAQMLVYDVNGDGVNDVITCLNAHGYGLAWYEQVRTNGAITFRQHLILNPDATPSRDGFSFTQPHALALADIDGDRLMDIVTGKRFWAHGKNGGDPESDGFPAVLCWFQLKRPGNGAVEFIPHLIDNDSGVGTQVSVEFISNKEHPDIVVGNKKGLFVLKHQVASPTQ
jgi:HEAT repeat protein